VQSVFLAGRSPRMSLTFDAAEMEILASRIAGRF
jgi:hypothetical protein